MSQPLVLRLLAASVNVTSRAGTLIRDILAKGDLGIVEKGKNDVQTEADRAAQRCIIASLHKQFPKVAIFGEEEFDPNETIQPDWIDTNLSQEVLALADKWPQDLANVKDEDVTVWVDPVDGTAEYTEGLLDHVTVLIGIAVKGIAVAGVVYQPYYNYKAGPGAKLGRAVWAALGFGLHGLEIKSPPEGQHIITTTRSHGTKSVNDAVTSCEPTSELRVGGAGHKVLLLLEGKAHAYVFGSPGCKKWDTCAPEVLLHAAGGKLTDIHGNPILYHATVQRRNSGGVLATLSLTHHRDHDWYLSRIPQSVRDALPVS